MKIHIMGASCAGATTLGTQLAQELDALYLDTDAFFWLPTPIPFTERRDFQERNNLLKSAMLQHEHVIIGGSLVNWGPEWSALFDLIVFLYIPKEIRLQRLKAREIERYGDCIVTDPVRAGLYQEFISWAAGYDDNTTSGRNLNTHLNWLAQVKCPVLKITGNTTVAERLYMVHQKIQELSLLTQKGL